MSIEPSHLYDFATEVGGSTYSVSGAGVSEMYSAAGGDKVSAQFDFTATSTSDVEPENLSGARRGLLKTLETYIIDSNSRKTSPRMLEGYERSILALWCGSKNADGAEGLENDGPGKIFQEEYERVLAKCDGGRMATEKLKNVFAKTQTRAKQQKDKNVQR